MTDRGPEFARKLRQEFGTQRAILMEVCGTHTNMIRRAGIHQLLPEGVRLLAGPGCPVCVTGSGYIQQAVELSRDPGIIIASFGDLLKVPGNNSDLTAARAGGAKVQVVYSPLDAVELARQHPAQQVVFLGVGFETTAPVIALAVKAAASGGISNFSVLPALKVLNPALRVLLNSAQLKLDGLIAPGHLSVITGAAALAFLPEQYHLPTVITGFQPAELWLGIGALLHQIKHGEARLENQYSRVVTAEGNQTAQRLLAEVFRSEATEWRGLGVVPDSGLGFAEAYQNFDARIRLQLAPVASEEPPGCKCGLILLGQAEPEDCPHFGAACIPEHPVGPCMVSSEGACAAHFYYRKRGETNGR